MEQEIGFVRSGGRRLAYATVGDGQPLVLPPWWVSHPVADWQGARFRAFVEGLATHRRVVRFDRLGTGYSDRERSPDSYTLDAEVDALTAVTDALGLESFTMIGISCGGCTAARYAARAIALRLGREVAALVRGARFVDLDGETHLPWHGDTEPVLAEIAPFLGFEPPTVRHRASDAARGRGDSPG